MSSNKEGNNKIGTRRREGERDVEKMNDEEGNGVG
jgi:hypothetical protein